MSKPTGAPPTTALLLEKVEAFIRRFLIFQSEAQSIAISLWVLHTHAVDAAEQSPYLAITSAEMQSAKSRVLEVLELIVPRPWRIETPSEAVVFRKIHADSPTLLLDETDAIFTKGKDADKHEGLRALLNAGNRRGSKVPRCVGGSLALKNFEVFCPKALAGIGNLPGTIESRSIPIRMARKHKGETVERFRVGKVSPQGLALHAQLARWSIEVGPLLEDAEPELPEELSDRQQDSWEPLLAIADDAGGNWPKKARDAATELHRGGEVGSVGTLLLGHVREAFEKGQEMIPTGELLRKLVARDDGPWASWWARDINAESPGGPAVRLAQLLRPYDISSNKFRIGMLTHRGYKRSDFEQVWERYLQPVSEGDS